MDRILISICGGSGSGKSTLAKELAARLGEERASRVSTDFFLQSNPYPTLDEFFRHPLVYDWTLLAKRLQGAHGLARSTPQYDFIQFRRSAAEGGRPFTLRPIMILDAMLPYPAADFAFLIDTPDDVRRARIIARDQAWGTRVIDFWPQHQLTLAQLRQNNCQFTARLSGLDSIEDNLQRICALTPVQQAW
jgi:uridine kinase